MGVAIGMPARGWRIARMALAQSLCCHSGFFFLKRATHLQVCCDADPNSYQTNLSACRS